jgi:two-component system, NarL family, sensor kinase
MSFLKQRKNYCVFIFFLWLNPLKGQPDYYKHLFTHAKDSLVKELRKFPSPDTSRVMALINILDCATFLSERREVMPYWQEANQLSDKLKFKKGQAITLVWRGSFYKSERKTDSALIYLDSAIHSIGSPNDQWLHRTKGFALFQTAMIYEGQENFYTALKAYFEAFTDFDSADLFKQKMVAMRIASIYQQLHNDDKALEYYKLALTLYEKAGVKTYSSEEESIYSFIAGIYFNRGELEKANYYLDKIRPSMPDTVETLVTGGYYHLAGQIAEKEGKPDSAIGYLNEALKYYNYTRQMHTNDIANVCADITHLKIITGELPEAGKYAAQSVAAAKESGHKETMANSLIALAEYYGKTGRQSDAYQALQHAIVLNDSVLTEANLKQANTLSAIYENDKKEHAIAQLETDKKIQLTSVRQAGLLNTIFFVAIVALILLSGVSYLYFKNKQKIERQKIAELEKEKQLMGIEAMLKGQEEERTRLAKDLHDGLGSMLSGVKISFSNMKENVIMDAANTRAFEKSLDQLDKTIAELRKVAHNLMPEALVKFGLRSAVKDFCESIQLSGNTEIICEQFGAERDLGNIADVNVYRIIQELVNNAVIHGQATQILVQLTKTEERVLITVEDNGKGFELSSLKKATGIGLTNIQSRVNYFNGLLDINSKPAKTSSVNEGTTVNIELIA